MQSVCVLSAHLQVRIGCPPIGLTIGNIAAQLAFRATAESADSQIRREEAPKQQKISTARNISSLPALDAVHLPCCCERNAPAISNEMPKEKVFRRKGTLRL